MQEIMFSVAIITYNQEKYISQTLDSILNQEHDYKYEIIIGEDCSTDNTKEIIEEYVEKYPKIIKPLYNTPNKGLINNYFNVINHCQGKYIMECAGDDYWLPGKVAKQIEFMENNLDVGMCYGKAKVWNEINQKFERKTIGSDGKSFEYILTNGNVIPALTVCLKNELVQKYIREIGPLEKKWLMEDYPMWLWFSHESKVKFLNETTAVYRVLEDSASHSVDMEKQLRFEQSLDDIRIFFSKIYKVYIELQDEAHVKFYLYVNRMKNKYFSDLAAQMKLEYKKIKKKNLNIYIYYLCSHSAFLWNVLCFFKSRFL